MPRLFARERPPSWDWGPCWCTRCQGRIRYQPRSIRRHLRERGFAPNAPRSFRLCHADVIHADNDRSAVSSPDPHPRADMDEDADEGQADNFAEEGQAEDFAEEGQEGNFAEEGQAEDSAEEEPQEGSSSSSELDSDDEYMDDLFPQLAEEIFAEQRCERRGRGRPKKDLHDTTPLYDQANISAHHAGELLSTWQSVNGITDQGMDDLHTLLRCVFLPDGNQLPSRRQAARRAAELCLRTVQTYDVCGQKECVVFFNHPTDPNYQFADLSACPVCGFARWEDSDQEIPTKPRGKVGFYFNVERELAHLFTRADLAPFRELHPGGDADGCSGPEAKLDSIYSGTPHVLINVYLINSG